MRDFMMQKILIIFDKFENWLNRILLKYARSITTIHPNSITKINLVVGLSAAFILYLSKYNDYLIVASSLLIVFNILLDVLDGLVARVNNKQSKKGAFMDIFFDQLTDASISIVIMLNMLPHKIVGTIVLVIPLIYNYLNLSYYFYSKKKNSSVRSGLLLILAILLLTHFILSKCGINTFYFEIIRTNVIELILILYAFFGIFAIANIARKIFKALDDAC